MRAREILDEDYNQNLQLDLDNLLIGAKSANANNVDIDNLVTQLTGMGYSVDSNSIQSLLQNNPNVQNSTDSDVVLANINSASPNQQDQEDSAAQVKNMADAAAKKGM